MSWQGVSYPSVVLSPDFFLSPRLTRLAFFDNKRANEAMQHTLTPGKAIPPATHSRSPPSPKGQATNAATERQQAEENYRTDTRLLNIASSAPVRLTKARSSVRMAQAVGLPAQDLWYVLYLLFEAGTVQCDSGTHQKYSSGKEEIAGELWQCGLCVLRRSWRSLRQRVE